MYKSNKIKQIVYFMAIVLFSNFYYAYGVTEQPAIKEFGLREPEGTLSKETMAKTEIAKPLEYIISEEDVMDIIVWQMVGTTQKEGEEREYTITKGDVLGISVWQWPDLATDAIVRPDGKLSFPLVGDIDVEGLTLTELDNILTEKLTDYIRSPQVSVMIKSFGGISGAAVISTTIPFVKINDLSTQVVVLPDGKISLPLIGDIQASGLTLNELKDALTEKLKSYIKEPEVSISMRTFGGKKIIVLGEVTSPGVYKSSGEINLIEVIGLAGGYTQDAVLKSVLVVRGNLDNPEAIRVDVNKAIKKGDLSQNIIIRPHDIVYVPRNFIKDVNYFLDNIIRPLTNASTAVPAIRVIRMGTSIKKK